MIALFLTQLEQLFGWLLSASWQAAVLAIVVLLLQLVLRGRLNPRWRYALWLLVITRLLLPLEPESALSLFQFAPQPSPSLTAPVTEPLFAQVPLLDVAPEIPKVQLHTSTFSLFSLLAIIWLGGVIALSLLTWQVNRRFMRQVAASPEVDDAGLLHLFAEAKAELGIHRHIRLIENAHLQSPAIMGLFHPTLLLPAKVREKFDATELRLIFLHELAHLKRGDILVQGLIALLQILHWFNPVLWFAFRRMRADREPATDALVLSRAGEAEKERYGLMLIKLLEHFNQRHSLPTLVGIFEDKDQFKRRFSLIAKFTRGAYGWSLLGILVIALLAVGCLTKSKAIKPSDTTKQPAQTYLEVSYVETVDTSVMPGGVTTTNEAAKSLIQNPKNKHVILNDFALNPGTNTLKGKMPWGADFTINLNLSNSEPNHTQDLDLNMEWPHANGGDVSYVSKFKVILQPDECFLVTGPWKTKETSNLLISLVDPSEKPKQSDPGFHVTDTTAQKNATPPMSEAEAKQKGIAALVNGKPIYWADVDYGFVFSEAYRKNTGLTLQQQIDAARFGKVESFIDQELAVQSAEALGYQTPQSVLDGRVEFCVKGFGGDKNAFLKNLEKNGLTLDRFNAMNRASDMYGHMLSLKVFDPLETYMNDKLPPSWNSTEQGRKMRNTLSYPEMTKLSNEWTQDMRSKAVIQRFYDPKPVETSRGSDASPTVTISGKIHFVHPELVDFEKSTSYLAPIGGVADEFHFQPDGTYTLPLVKPGIYNRRIHVVRKEVGPLPAEAVDMDLSPIQVNGTSPNLTMNLNLDVPFKNVAKGMIEVGLKVAEINDDVYLANKAGVDTAVEKSDFNFLNNLKGVSLLSTPRVSTKSGQKASIEIIRAFAFPTRFDNAKVIPASVSGSQTKLTMYVPPTPREFTSKNVGVTSEITPKLNQGKINLSGKFNVTNFTGFIEGSQGSRMPTFQSNESYFMEELDDNQEKGIWIPGLHVDEQQPNTSVKKRYIVFLGAQLVK